MALINYLFKVNREFSTISFEVVALADNSVQTDIFMVIKNNAKWLTKYTKNLPRMTK